MIDQAIAWAAPATAWMLTYLLHSTLLLGAAWLVSRRLAGRSLALEETLWRAALVGALVTASLQAGLGWRPVAGSWTLAAMPAVAPTATASLDTAAAAPEDAAGHATAQREFATRDAATIRDPFQTPRRGEAAGDAPFVASTAARLVESPRPEPAASAGARQAAAGSLGLQARPAGARSAAGNNGPAASWPLFAVLAWLAVAAVLLTALLAARVRLARSLRERWPVQRGAMPALLGRLRTRAGLARPVRLTGAERLPVPIAFGLARPEICLPGRAVREMSPYHQESILAHELAHLLRRDPAWLLLARGMEAAFFFQPLNRLARRRLQEIAEYRCDDRAVQLTGRPLELARCLTEVAAWRLAESAALPVPTMAVAGGSALSRRVRRLLDGESDAGRRLPSWLALTAVAGLLALTTLAPAVTAAPGEAPPPEEPPALSTGPAVAELPPPAEPPVLPDPPPRHPLVAERLSPPGHLAPAGASTAPLVAAPDLPRPPGATAIAPRPPALPLGAPAPAPQVRLGSPGPLPAPAPAPAPLPAPAAAGFPAPRSAPEPGPAPSVGSAVGGHAPAPAPAPTSAPAPAPASAPAPAPPALRPTPGATPAPSPAPTPHAAPALGRAPRAVGTPAAGSRPRATPAPGPHGAAGTTGEQRDQRTREQREQEIQEQHEQRIREHREQRTRAEQREREVRTEQRAREHSAEAGARSREQRQGAVAAAHELARQQAHRQAHEQRLRRRELEQAVERRAAELVRVRVGDAGSVARLTPEQRAALAQRLQREMEASTEHRVLADALRHEHAARLAAAEARLLALRSELERELPPGADGAEERVRALAAARAEIAREIERHREETGRALEAARRELERELARQPARPAEPQPPPR